MRPFVPPVRQAVLITSFLLIAQGLLSPLATAGGGSNPPKLVSVERVAPPKKLYHWTSAGWLGEWAKTAQKTGQTSLPLLTGFKGKLSGSILEKSLRPEQTGAVFAWDHPIGGMGWSGGLYPEKNHPDEAAEGMFKMFGGDRAKDEAGFQKFKTQMGDVFGRMEISGIDSGTNNRFLVDMDIDPNTVAIKVKIEPQGMVWPEDNYIREIIPELAEGKAQMIYFEYGTMREWIILDNKAIQRFNADPRYQKELLKPYLENLKAGVALKPEEVHVGEGYVQGEKGSKEATQIVQRLVDDAEGSSKRVPEFFKKVPMKVTSETSTVGTASTVKAPVYPGVAAGVPEKAKVQVVSGDLTKIEVDAYVVPHSPGGRSTGGVGGAVYRAGAKDGMQAYDQLVQDSGGRLEYGTAHAAKSGGGKSQLVVNVVTVGAPQEQQTVADAVYNALLKAEGAGAKSVGIPALGTGVAGKLTADQSAQGIADGIERYLSGGGSIQDIQIVVMESRTLPASAYQKAVNRTVSRDNRYDSLLRELTEQLCKHKK